MIPVALRVGDSTVAEYVVDPQLAPTLVGLFLANYDAIKRAGMARENERVMPIAPG